MAHSAAPGASLPVAIYRDDRLLRIEHLDDPRLVYVEVYNERHADDGLRAVIEPPPNEPG